MMIIKKILPTFICLAAIIFMVTIIDKLTAKAEFTADPGKGARLYSQYCAPCHGKNGDGDGDRAKMEKLDPRPRIHSNGAYMNQIPDMRLYRIIKHGAESMNFSHIMPQWQHILSDENVVNLIAHIRSLATNPEYAARQSPGGCACRLPRPEGEKPF